MEKNRKRIQLGKSNKSLIYKMVLLFFLGLIFLPLVNANDDEIYSNHNIRAVQNLKTTTFKLSRSMFITRIETYHWNDQKGKPPGSIGIRGVGLWPAKGSPGMYDTPNAYWTVYPNIKLNPGIYSITDSDPATWSQNSGSDGFGFVKVFGKLINGSSSTSSQQTVMPQNTDVFKENLPPAEIKITDYNAYGIYPERGVLNGNHYIFQHRNGTSSEYVINRFGNGGVHISRLDIKGQTTGMRGEYIGKLTGNRTAEGTATWTWKKWEKPLTGTWKASW